MVTTHYSDQQGSKSRKKVLRLYKQWHRQISKWFIKPPYSIIYREQPRSTRIVVAYRRPAFSATNLVPLPFFWQVQVLYSQLRFQHFCIVRRAMEIAFVPVWLSGCLHVEGRLNEGPRLQRKHKDEKRSKAKQNKINVTPEKDVMTSANQTPGGHKFAPLMASQQGRANQHEPACFGL